MHKQNEKRIIFTGASGVGKSDLAELLARRIQLPLIPELARQICLSLGYARIGEIPNQEGFKWQVLRQQINEEEKLKSFISDRSTIDSWVLWQRWNISTAMTYHSEEYYSLARAQAEKYTHIIYIPPMFPAAEDGFRWTDPHYQTQIDRMVRSTLYDFELWQRTYTVRSLPTPERLEEVVSWLTDYS